jgi:hypothetical protein
MSLKAVDAASEGTNGVGRGGGTNVRLKPAAADDINRTVEQSRDAILERDVFVDADQGRRSGTPIRDADQGGRIDFDHDLDVAVGPVVAARASRTTPRD